MEHAERQVRLCLGVVGPHEHELHGPVPVHQEVLAPVLLVVGDSLRGPGAGGVRLVVDARAVARPDPVVEGALVEQEVDLPGPVDEQGVPGAHRIVEAALHPGPALVRGVPGGLVRVEGDVQGPVRGDGDLHAVGVVRDERQPAPHPGSGPVADHLEAVDLAPGLAPEHDVGMLGRVHRDRVRLVDRARQAQADPGARAVRRVDDPGLRGMPVDDVHLVEAVHDEERLDRVTRARGALHVAREREDRDHRDHQQRRRAEHPPRCLITGPSSGTPFDHMGPCARASGGQDDDVAREGRQELHEAARRIQVDEVLDPDAGLALEVDPGLHARRRWGWASGVTGAVRERRGSSWVASPIPWPRP